MARREPGHVPSGVIYMPCVQLTIPRREPGHAPSLVAWCPKCQPTPVVRVRSCGRSALVDPGASAPQLHFRVLSCAAKCGALVRATCLEHGAPTRSPPAFSCAARRDATPAGLVCLRGRLALVDAGGPSLPVVVIGDLSRVPPLPFGHGTLRTIALAIGLLRNTRLAANNGRPPPVTFFRVLARLLSPLGSRSPHRGCQ